MSGESEQKVTVRTATHDDMPAVIALLSNAAEWLRSIGSDQWQRPPRVDRIRDDIAAGNVYLFTDQAGAPVATLTMDTLADADFWTADDDPGSAMYLHRIAVARRAAGRGLGVAILDWAAERAERAGYRWLRLDAWRSNAGLLDYYRRSGWTHLRTVDAPARFSGALFQKAVDDHQAQNEITVIDHADTTS